MQPGADLKGVLPVREMIEFQFLAAGMPLRVQVHDAVGVLRIAGVGVIRHAEADLQVIVVVIGHEPGLGCQEGHGRQIPAGEQDRRVHPADPVRAVEEDPSVRTGDGGSAVIIAVRQAVPGVEGDDLAVRQQAGHPAVGAHPEIPRSVLRQGPDVLVGQAVLHVFQRRAPVGAFAETGQAGRRRRPDPAPGVPEQLVDGVAAQAVIAVVPGQHLQIGAIDGQTAAVRTHPKVARLVPGQGADHVQRFEVLPLDKSRDPPSATLDAVHAIVGAEPQPVAVLQGHAYLLVGMTGHGSEAGGAGLQVTGLLQFPSPGYPAVAEDQAVVVGSDPQVAEPVRLQAAGLRALVAAKGDQLVEGGSCGQRVCSIDIQGEDTVRSGSNQQPTVAVLDEIIDGPVRQEPD